MRRVCDISKDRQASSSPDTHQKQSDLLGTIHQGMNRAACLIACLHPAPPTGIIPNGFNIQNILLFSFGVFLFLSISALLSPKQDEKSPEHLQKRQFTFCQERWRGGGVENQNILSNKINQFPVFIFCDAPVSFLLSE